MTAPIRTADLYRQGQRKPETLFALDQRDEWLRHAAAQFFPGVSQREGARQLHTRLSRYASTAWPLERAAPICPSRHDGKLTAIFWEILRAVDRAPGEKTICRALSARVPRHVVQCIVKPER